MKIVIVGGGKVGEAICQELSENEDIVLIDNNPKVLEYIFSQYDIQVVLGNGANVQVQQEATVEDAQVFLAVTNSDELNIIACIIAKKLGVEHTIARVRNPEYHSGVKFIQTALGITAMINPEQESAEAIAEIIKFPTAKNIDSFADGKVKIVEICVNENAFLINMTLKDFRSSFEGRLIVCIVERNGEVIIPKGDTVLLAGDNLYVTGSMEDLDRFYRALRKFNSPIESALIIGGGRLSYYLIDLLLKKSIQIKVIEVNREAAEKLSHRFPQIAVVCADGTDQDILEDEGISEYDCTVALTGIDEENIVISLFSKHMKVKKSIAKVNRTSMLKLLTHVGLDTIITPKRIIADKIVRFVRSVGATGNSAVEKLYKLADRKVEALEFITGEKSKTIGIPLAQLKILDNTLIAFIFRNHQLIFPDGEDFILDNDRVVIVTTHDNIVDLDDILVK